MRRPPAFQVERTSNGIFSHRRTHTIDAKPGLLLPMHFTPIVEEKGGSRKLSMLEVCCDNVSHISER
jgi:hypothetical protein